MSNAEEDCDFNCPYCSSPVSLRVDKTGGRSQRFVYDCEVCCRPIDVKIEISGNELVSFEAVPEE